MQLNDSFDEIGVQESPIFIRKFSAIKPSPMTERISLSKLILFLKNDEKNELIISEEALEV